MISVTLCPDCQKQVAVPDGTHETAEVQCPLCDTQFKLAEAVPDDLQSVAIIDPGEVAAEPAADALAAIGASSEETGDTGEGGDEIVGFSFDAGGDGSDLNLVDESSESVESFDLGGDQEDEVPAFSFDAGGDEDGGSATATAEATETTTTTATEPRKKKRRKGPGFVGNMVGIVVFGMVGLGLGYGILKWIAPDRAIPIDNFIDENWAKASSLWSDADVASGDGGGDVDSTDGSEPAATDGGEVNPFIPGSMLDDKDKAGKGGGGKRGKRGGKGAKNGNGAGDATDGGGPATTDGTDPSIDEPIVDPFGPSVEPDTPPADEHVNKAIFTVLIGGQPDSGETIKEFATEDLLSALVKARSATGADPFKLPPAYFAMCDVGDRATYLKGPAQTKDLLIEVEDLIRQIAVPSRHKILSRFSYQWMEFEKRTAYQDADGILLVGKVRRVAPVGSVFCSEIEITKDKDNTRRLLVLSSERPDFHVGDYAGVLGSVVRDVASQYPQLNPQGTLFEKFEADDSDIVLGARAIQLPEASE